MQRRLCSLDLRCSRRLKFHKKSNEKSNEKSNSLFPPPHNKRASEHSKYGYIHNGIKSRLRSRPRKIPQLLPQEPLASPTKNHCRSLFQEEEDYNPILAEPNHNLYFDTRNTNPLAPPMIPDFERTERDYVHSPHPPMPRCQLPISVYQSQTGRISAYF